MNLTPEQLDMIKRLQPLLKERRGEWQVGDNISLGDESIGIITLIKNILDGGAIYAVWPHNNHFQSRDTQEWADENFIWLPRFIDPDQPERGLWGMIDWKQWLLQDSDSLLRMKSIKSGNTHIYNPFTALLKALCEQEGV
jgi:hypothetical protein